MRVNAGHANPTTENVNALTKKAHVSHKIIDFSERLLISFPGLVCIFLLLNYVGAYCKGDRPLAGTCPRLLMGYASSFRDLLRSRETADIAGEEDAHHLVK